MAPLLARLPETMAHAADAPETLNTDPYGAGWMWKMKPADASQIAALLDAAAYEKSVAEA